MTIPVGIYCRVSDPAQERGTSLDTQRQRCVAYCEAHGYTVVAIICESEGGEFIYARTKFHELLARGDIQRVIVDIPDRLGRGDAEVILRHIAQEAGKPIEYATPQPDKATIEGMVVGLGQNLVSGIERLKIRDRTTRGRNARAREGRIIAGRQPPYGYRYATERDGRGRVMSCRLEIDEARMPIYRLIVGWVLVGIPDDSTPPMSIRGICKRLTKLGIATPSPRSTEWSYQTVLKILRNPVYKGQWEYGRNAWTLEDKRGGAKGRITHRRSDEDTIVVPCPASIDANTWAAVQAKIAENKAAKFIGPTKNVYLLRGLVTCEACTYRLIGEARKSGNGKKLTYYTCHQRRHKWTDPCKAGMVRADALEAAVWAAVQELAADDELIDAGKKHKAQGEPANYSAAIKAQERAIKDGEGELRKLSRLMLGKAEGAPTMRVYRQQEREIEARISSAEATLAEIKADEAKAAQRAAVVKATSTLRAELAATGDNATPERKRAALERLHTRCVWDSRARRLTVECVFGSVTVDI